MTKQEQVDNLQTGDISDIRERVGRLETAQFVTEHDAKALVKLFEKHVYNTENEAKEFRDLIAETSKAQVLATNKMNELIQPIIDSNNKKDGAIGLAKWFFGIFGFAIVMSYIQTTSSLSIVKTELKVLKHDINRYHNKGE